MSNQNPSGQESDESVDEQRARWEGANYGMTVCRNGYVNVHNQNYGECGDPLAHIHSVEVQDGEAVGCSCPHATYRDAHCKHQRAVESRPLVVSSATAAAASYDEPETESVDTGGALDASNATDDGCAVATDGGQVVETESTDDEGHECLHCDRVFDDVLVMSRHARLTCPERPNYERDLTVETCQSSNPKGWCNGPANADDEDLETCILCECYADGRGQDDAEPDMRCDECGHEWRESVAGAACPECGSTDRHPRRSTSADFGGGESTGVVDL